MSYLYACYIKYSSFGPQFIVDHCLAVCCRVQQPNRILSNVREKEKEERGVLFISPEQTQGNWPVQS